MNAVAAVRRALRPHIRRARSRWRRSLLLRVIAATVALGVLVLLVVGQLLLQAISDSLVDSARDAGQNDAAQQVKNTLASRQDQNFDGEQEFRTWIRDTLNAMHGPSDDPLRYVALRKQLDTSPGPISDQSLGVDASAIPVDLRREVAGNPDRLVTAVLTLPVGEVGEAVDKRVVAVGNLVDLGTIAAGSDQPVGGAYELYFVYPLDREIDILADVQRTFLVGAVALLVLIALVAWVVTRQVVDPVRQAARAAEQLASGRFDRRMPVRGEDELARLGRAFNEMAASLERQIHQLEELSRVQRRFVSDVSHELRTPLTTVRMAAEVIHEARSDLEPTLARSSELLVTQLDRFESLLSDLLEVSRFDAGAAVLEVDPIDVRKIVHRVVDHLRPLADRKGSRLLVHEPRGTVIVDVDARRVERILRNLVGNAIEHGEGRPVDIRVAMDDVAVAVGVRDHGVGLSQADVRMVFDRFWRADPARARTTGGTGLGLAIALEDAHLHGGWLQAWGEPGAGAHFRLTLPRSSGQVLSGSPLPLVPADALVAERS
ncbi:MAG: HAMP domain-containing histidine kinase [Kineosporiaceae bacterium]|nr:HAMP domain-containing histidine kinase [Kineosporiaceae bacterium]